MSSAAAQAALRATGEGGHAARQAALLELLAGSSFHQAIVFCNHQPWAERIAADLCSAGFPAAFISGAQLKRFQESGSRVQSAEL